MSLDERYSEPDPRIDLPRRSSMKPRPRSPRPAPSLVLLALLAAALAAPAAHAVTHNVDAGGSSNVFSPPNLTIQAGDTVVWTNQGGFHNVAADDGRFRCAHGCDDQGGNGAVAGGWAFSRRFDSAGIVHYHCEMHGGVGGVGMSGTITVQG